MEVKNPLPRVRGDLGRIRPILGIPRPERKGIRSSNRHRHRDVDTIPWRPSSSPCPATTAETNVRHNIYRVYFILTAEGMRKAVWTGQNYPYVGQSNFDKAISSCSHLGTRFVPPHFLPDHNIANADPGPIEPRCDTSHEQAIRPKMAHVFSRSSSHATIFSRTKDRVSPISRCERHVR